MKRKLHYPERKFLDYYYSPDAHREDLGRHLLSCPPCRSHYHELERFLNNLKSAFSEEREIDWGLQRRHILAKLREPEGACYVIPWRKIAPVAAAILISVGLIFSLNDGKSKPPADEYSLTLSQNDDLLIKEVQNLMNRPLSETMETINFWMDLAEQGEQSGSLSPAFRSAGYEKS